MLILVLVAIFMFKGYASLYCKELFDGTSSAVLVMHGKDDC